MRRPFPFFSSFKKLNGHRGAVDELYGAERRRLESFGRKKVPSHRSLELVLAGNFYGIWIHNDGGDHKNSERERCFYSEKNIHDFLVGDKSDEDWRIPVDSFFFSSENLFIHLRRNVVHPSSFLCSAWHLIYSGRLSVHETKFQWNLCGTGCHEGKTFTTSDKSERKNSRREQIFVDSVSGT